MPRLKDWIQGMLAVLG